MSHGRRISRRLPLAALLLAAGLLAGAMARGSETPPYSPSQIAEAAGEEVYEQFNRFALQNFGAEKDPLVYDTFGSELQFTSRFMWTYISERSAVIAFETNLPAQSFVQFGPTSAYGSETEEPERYFYLHLHYLTGLEPDTTYHYQVVARDERGNVITSQDYTFTTRSTAGTIHIPNDLSGPPYILDQEGATYVVTQDLVVPGTAFEIAAPGITLDLGGHRIVYNSQPHPGGISDPRDDAYYGVKTRRYAGVKDIKILNGILEQGPGNDASVGSIGFNPIYISSAGGRGTEIAFVTAIYSGPQVSGIFIDWPGDEPYNIHHNITLDRGTEVLNRHGAGVRGILIYDYRGTPGVRNATVHHNLVKRSRHAGLTGNVLYNNEVYIDSYDTNAYAIAPLDFREGHGYEAFNNRVFGTGYHVVGFAWGNNLHIYNNFVHLQGVEPTNRSEESGTHASVIGMRLTQYNGSTHPYEDNLYENNVIAIYGREGTTLVRGVQFMSDPNVKNLRFRNNIVKVIIQDESSPRAAAAIVAEGGNGCEDNPPVIYEHNTLISNIANVQIGDSYGNAACNHYFLENTFIADEGTLHPDYATFKYGFWDSSAPQRNTVVRDAVLQGAASLDSVRFQNDEQDLRVEWTLTIRVLDAYNRPVADASVLIKEIPTGNIERGRTDANGTYTTPLVQYVARQSGKTEHTPHWLLISDGDWSDDRIVTMDRPRTEVFHVGGPTASFDDVPPNHPYYPYIEALYQAGYVKGCSIDPPLYCPDRAMNRAESAVFTVRGVHGADFMPSQPTEQVFADVALDAWHSDWVTQLWEDGYTAGCSTDPLLYCPERTHTRAEGAVFFLRMMYGADYQPPPGRGYFVDVPPDAWYANWVDGAWEAGIAEACGVDPLRYCPEEPLTRAVAAYMMAHAKGLVQAQTVEGGPTQ